MLLQMLGGKKKIIKGRKEVFSERLEGEQGLGGDMENKQTRQQTARRGGGSQSWLCFCSGCCISSCNKKKRREKRMDGRWHGGLNGLA